MLPFGHLAAGYLAADAVLNAVKPNLSPAQLQSLTLWGTFFAFAPDLDFFYAFLKVKRFTIPGKLNHRDYWTHRPLLWLAASLIIIILAPSEYWRWLGIVVLLGSWIHFILDSLRTGVRWLWPFNKRFFALQEPGVIEENPAKGFFNHWINMVKLYRARAPMAFYLEIILILIAIFYII